MSKKIILLKILILFSIFSFSQKASYYAKSFHGRKTASGQIFNNNLYTAAHRSYKFGTKLKVTNVKNGKSIIVVVNDRGPFVKSRIIDLSISAFKMIGDTKSGTISVKIEKV